MHLNRYVKKNYTDKIKPNISVVKLLTGSFLSETRMVHKKKKYHEIEFISTEKSEKQHHQHKVNMSFIDVFVVNLVYFLKSYLTSCLSLSEHSLKRN